MGADLYKLPPELQKRAQAELKPGEIVSWAGQPVPGRYARGTGYAWLFFIPWTGFALFWIAGAAGFKVPDFSSGRDFFPLFGVPFVLVGISGLSSPLWMRRRAASVVYVVTNQRAFSIEGRRTLTVRSYLPAQLAAITRREYPDGTGDLVLQAQIETLRRGGGTTREYGFIGVTDVKTVGRLLEDLGARRKS
jgi:hypothetical protein